jgi:hypothetical protein
LSAQQLAKIVTTGLSAKLLPALQPPQRGKLKKKLPRQTSVPNIWHIIAGSVRRIDLTPIFNAAVSRVAGAAADGTKGPSRIGEIVFS